MDKSKLNSNINEKDLKEATGGKITDLDLDMEDFGQKVQERKDEIKSFIDKVYSAITSKAGASNNVQFSNTLKPGLKIDAEDIEHNKIK